MPSYYNHNEKKKYSPEETDLNTREINKLKVKHAKTMTSKTRMQIAEDLDTTLSMIDKLWAEIKEEEVFKLEEKVDAEIRRQIRQYEIMNIELFAAWEMSKQQIQKRTMTEGESFKGPISTEKIQTEDRLPDPRYMEMIAKNNKEIASLLGITKHVEVNFNQQNNEINVITDDFTPLVPEQHNSFIKKPKELPAGEFTSIEDVDEAEVLEDGEDLESID